MNIFLTKFTVGLVNGVKSGFVQLVKYWAKRSELDYYVVLNCKITKLAMLVTE